MYRYGVYINFECVHWKLNVNTLKRKTYQIKNYMKKFCDNILNEMAISLVNLFNAEILLYKCWSRDTLWIWTNQYDFGKNVNAKKGNISVEKHVEILFQNNLQHEKKCNLSDHSQNTRCVWAEILFHISSTNKVRNVYTCIVQNKTKIVSLNIYEMFIPVLYKTN